MDYVAEGGFAFSGINGWLDKTSGFAVLLVGDSDEPSPQWSNGTRAADHEALPVDADDIAAGRVRITSNVGNAIEPLGSAVATCTRIYGSRTTADSPGSKVALRRGSEPR